MSLIYCEVEDVSTSDLQHDLALLLTDPKDLEDLSNEYAQELKSRNEPLPINCRFEHNIYAPSKRKLTYDLK